MNVDDIISYRELCDQENVQTLQRGMNFALGKTYSVILMSQRNNAPYQDKVLSDGITIEYEGHDESKNNTQNPKLVDQSKNTRLGSKTQNGKFIESIEEYKKGFRDPELVKVYEKILPGVWSFKGYFDLIDYYIKFDGYRNVFIFKLKLSQKNILSINNDIDLEHSRVIPSFIKKEVFKRDQGKCVICGSNKNLHFDHDLPFSRGGTSLTVKNIRLLCMVCNLKKSDKIE